MAVSHDDVRNAFRFILGRPPEDKRVVKFHSGHASVSDLRLALLSSTEFRDQGFITPTKAFSAFDPPKTIEIEADEMTLKTMITQMEAYWSEIGKYAPHYSVLTDDRYTPGRLNENEAAFWETGTSDRDFILALLCRTGRSASEFRCCVDYGCGI